MTNKYCSNCGEPAVSLNSNACTNCGKPFQSGSEAQHAGNIVHAKEKSTFVAILLSFVAPGSGQAYNGQLKKGIFILVGYWIVAIFILPALAIWIYAMYDAYKKADEMNRGEIPFAEATSKDAVIYIASYVVIEFIFVAIILALTFLPFFLFAF